MRAKLFAVIAALTVFGFVCQASAITLNNGAPTTAWCCFGTPNTATYGEVFTAPISGTLNSFTLYLNSGVSDLYGGVGDWNGANPTLVLYQSATVNSLAGGPFTFTPSLSVTAGTQYFAFLSVIGILSTGTAGMPSTYASVPGIDYFAFYNQGGVGGWACPQANCSDSAVPYAEFSATFEPTPLPAALPLFATGLGALGLLGWRSKRKAAALAAV